jgi:hypothetical protein
MNESSVSPNADTWPPTAEPAVAIPEEDTDVIPDTAIPFRLTPLVFGEVPVTAELLEAVRVVDAALVIARANQPSVSFVDLAGAVYAAGADA